MEKKDVAIVFGITKDYAFALANVLIGMKKHCKKFWDAIIVYHDNLTKEDQNNLNKILKCEFVKYDKKFSANNFDTDTIKNYSFLSLARFECFKLLRDYKKVIWQDVDILVQGDFSDLLQYGNKSGFAATLNDAHFFVEANFFSTIPGYSMYKKLYNAGILVLSDILDYNKIYDWLYNTTNRWSKQLRWLDQGVLNLMIQEFNIDVENIDILKYCCHPSKPETDVATIVHAYGSDKFWNSLSLSSKFPEWEINNNEWKKLSDLNSMSKKSANNTSNTINTKDSPKCSVLMSIYNKTTYMDEAIKSILNQTFSNFEFIIVVEYSSIQDKIVKLLEQYNDSRIVIIKNKTKLGFAASLNVGIDAARSDFIARMDDDDISVPDRLEKEINFLNNNPDISVVGRFY